MLGLGFRGSREGSEEVDGGYEQSYRTGKYEGKLGCKLKGVLVEVLKMNINGVMRISRSGENLYICGQACHERKDSDIANCENLMTAEQRHVGLLDI